MTEQDSPDALTRWLRAHAARLSTLDPDAEDDTDLEPLLDIVGDARVVAIGESMHRAHEFLQLRHRVFRFLARRAGFTALVLESGFPEGAIVDGWLRDGGAGVRGVLERGISYGFGRCEEQLDQLARMREQRLRSGLPLRFSGMDLADSAASALTGVETALGLLDDLDPAYAAHAHSTLLPLFAYLPRDRSGIAQAAITIQAYLALPAAIRYELTARIGDLVARLRARRPEFRTLADPERVETALRAAEVAQATDAFLAAMTAGPTRTWPGANLRDATMADTVEWILRREPRVVIGAANGHVQKRPFLAPPFVPSPMTTVGEHLADRLGTDYVVIGSAFDGGEAWLHRPRPEDRPGHSTPFVQRMNPAAPSSLDGALSSASTEPYLVDLRGVDGEAAALLDATSGTLNGDELQPVDARAAFDAMAFVGTVTPWHTWIETPR
ncbi:erythromycin esterase family protein [Leifsonia sp. F6_8S_P_1B]|uniref:Erythromycin esterase family protein n=1 Tax=Leifsonia williamsii TaxID=3035919 RepID=A0ABT8KDB2_9MICO|nr:erythromycin esterase family protein [Leifsonia williamsii]MDN4615162.1 erythromycin esterase family protein [Leifsonia williamsii]